MPESESGALPLGDAPTAIETISVQATPAALTDFYGDPTGIRTRVTAVKGRCLRPLDHGAWSGWRDLNPRPLAPKASALAKLRHIPQNLMQITLYLNKVCASSSANTTC